MDYEHYDAEIHIAHNYTDGTLGAIVAVFFDRKAGGNKTNPFLSQVAANMATIEG